MGIGTKVDRGETEKREKEESPFSLSLASLAKNGGGCTKTSSPHQGGVCVREQSRWADREREVGR